MAEKIGNNIVKALVAIGALVGGGYMFFTGESLGWIVAGAVGGVIVLFMALGLLAGVISFFFGHDEISAGERDATQRIALGEYYIKHS